MSTLVTSTTTLAYPCRGVAPRSSAITDKWYTFKSPASNLAASVKSPVVLFTEKMSPYLWEVCSLKRYHTRAFCPASGSVAWRVTRWDPSGASSDTFQRWKSLFTFSIILRKQLFYFVCILFCLLLTFNVQWQNVHDKILTSKS